jgi:hypothetical protein
MNANSIGCIWLQSKLDRMMMTIISTVMIGGIALIGFDLLLLLIRLFCMIVYFKFKNMWNDNMQWFMSNYLIITVAL